MITMPRPPYQITEAILNLVAACAELIGSIQAFPAKTVSPRLRKQNKIKSIFGSLKIEGNSLSLGQITAILNQQKIIGPAKDIREVKNAVVAYDSLPEMDIYSEKDFLTSHKVMLKNIVENPGKYRTRQVGVLAGDKVAHVAPGHRMVPKLMNDLFQYLQQSKNENTMITSSVFHYEMEFIHPFPDGNGRMGRLWQSAILAKAYPVFRNIPVENAIREKQREYYEALALSDKAGQSTLFIEFMLGVIKEALAEFYGIFGSEKESAGSRIAYAIEEFGKREFSRKDYMKLFIGLSTATASRDLRDGLEKKLLGKTGDKRLTRYQIKKKPGK